MSIFLSSRSKMTRLSPLGIFLWIAGIVGGLHALSVVLICFRLLRLELRAYPVRRIEAEDVLPAVRAFLEGGARPLEALGFVIAGFDAYRSIDDDPDLPEKISLILEHPDLGVWAYVDPSSTQDAAAPYAYGFRAWFEDGTAVVGTNGTAWARLGEPQGIEYIDSYKRTVEEHWENFRTQIEHRVRQRGLHRHTFDTYIAAVSRQAPATSKQSRPKA